MKRRTKRKKMSGAGAPDFFYREAQRLGYVARSAFKVPFCFFVSLPFYIYINTHTYVIHPFLFMHKTAASDTEAVQAHNPRLLCSRPWLCSWCLASGTNPTLSISQIFFFSVYIYFMSFISFSAFLKLFPGSLPKLGSPQ